MQNGTDRQLAPNCLDYTSVPFCNKLNYTYINLWTQPAIANAIF